MHPLDDPLKQLEQVHAELQDLARLTAHTGYSKAYENLAAQVSKAIRRAIATRQAVVLVDQATDNI